MSIRAFVCVHGISGMALATLLSISAGCFGVDGTLNEELLARCLSAAPSSWSAFNSVVADASIGDAGLRAAIDAEQNWQRKVVLAAVRAVREGRAGPAAVCQELLALERSWHKPEAPAHEVPTELAAMGIGAIGLPGFSPQRPLHHVMARRDRLRPASEDGVQDIIAYVMITLPASIPSVGWDAVGLSERHELLCLRVMLFMRQALDPFDERMKGVVLLEMGRQMRYEPLRSCVTANADADLISALGQVEPCDVWGDALAVIDAAEAREILFRWSQSDKPETRTMAYIALMKRRDKFEEESVAQRVNELHEKFYSNEVRMQRLHELQDAIEKLQEPEGPSEK